MLGRKSVFEVRSDLFYHIDGRNERIPLNYLARVRCSCVDGAWESAIICLRAAVWFGRVVPSSVVESFLLRKCDEWLKVRSNG